VEARLRRSDHLKELLACSCWTSPSRSLTRAAVEGALGIVKHSNDAAPLEPGLRHTTATKRETGQREKPFCFSAYQGRQPSSCVGPGANERRRLALHGRGLAFQRVRDKEDSRQLAVLEPKDTNPALLDAGGRSWCMLRCECELAT
jgi:hypothetical protein